MKEILLAVMGTSPQVLTETLYALHIQGKPFPDEIYLITSENARDKVIRCLIEEKQLNKLKEHYELPDFKFDESHIFVMQDARGSNVISGREESDQQAIADSIVRLVAKFTSDPECRIHASIAGGRKSMAFYMGCAMSMYAREQDTLSHVFVSKQFEFTESFYFPTKQDNYIANNDVVLNTKDAEVVLAEIPFVRMSNMIDDSLLKLIEGSSFSQTVATLNAYKKNGVKLQLNCKARTMTINGVNIKLSPKEFAFYLWLTRQEKRTISADRAFYESKSFSADFLSLYAQLACDSRLFNSFGVEQEQVEELSGSELANLIEIKPMTKDFVQQTRTRINQKIKKALDIEGATAIQICSEEQQKPHMVRYYLNSDVAIVDDFPELHNSINPKPNQLDVMLTALSSKK